MGEVGRETEGNAERGGWRQCTRATHSRAAGCNTGLAGVTRVGSTQLKKPLIFANQGLLFGGLGRNRTTDTRIFNPPKKARKINNLVAKSVYKSIRFTPTDLQVRLLRKSAIVEAIC